MNKEEALNVLEISDDPSGPDIVCKVKQRLKKLHKDSIENLSEKIEACKFLIDDQEDQAEVFSYLVISAINDDKLDFLKLLLETVKNDNEFNYLNTEGTGGNIPLNFALGHTSCKHESRIKAISLLLKYGANPNIKDQEGKLLLCCIIDSHGDIDRYKAVELLLDKGVNPNVQDNQGRTPLHYLCSKCYEAGSVEIAKLLLRRGADPDSKDQSGKKLIDLVNHDSSVGRLFGAVNYKKAFRFGCATLLTTAGSIALISGVADAYIGKVWCSTLAVGMAAIALYCAYQAIKMMVFQGPQLNSLKLGQSFLIVRNHQIRQVKLNN